MRSLGLFGRFEPNVRAEDLANIETRIKQKRKPSSIRGMSELECAMLYLATEAKKHWQQPRKNCWLNAWLAEEYRVLEIVKALTLNPSDIDATNENFPNGFSLFYAVNAGSLALVRLCLARKVKLVYDLQGNTALDHALMSLAESPGGSAPEIFQIIAELLLAGSQAKQAARMLPWYRKQVSLELGKIAESEPEKVQNFLHQHFERLARPHNIIVFGAESMSDLLCQKNAILQALYTKLTELLSSPFLVGAYKK